MVKKIISHVLIFLLMFSFIGCSLNVDTKSKNSTEMNLTFIGASTTGTLFIILNALSECINMGYPDSNITIIPGSTVSNPTRISNNEADASLTHNVTAYAATQGAAPFSEKTENLSAIASLYPSVFQIAADKDSGITSMDDFVKNKKKMKFSIGQRGSISETLFLETIAEYGVSVEDIESWGGKVINQSMDNAAQMLAEGSIDAAVFSTLVPIPHLLDASKSNEVVILKIDQKVLQTLADKYQYQLTAIPDDSYPFLQEDIPTVCSHTIIIVPENSPEETAYKIAKAVTENLDYLKKVHVSMENLTPDLMVDNLGIPLHPGAEKYYREKGIIK